MVSPITQSIYPGSIPLRDTRLCVEIDEYISGMGVFYYIIFWLFICVFILYSYKYSWLEPMLKVNNLLVLTFECDRITTLELEE